LDYKFEFCPLKEYGESMMKASGFSREKIVYSAPDKTDPKGDLVTGMGELIMDFMEVAHWASKRQIEIGVRGYATRRYTTLERFLKRREKNHKLRVTWMRDTKHGTIKVYAKPRKTKNFDPYNFEDLYHGYCTTECLIRFMTTQEGVTIEERAFKGYGRVPEFGIQYENGTLLLCEFSTKHDTHYSGKIRGKLGGYDECLDRIDEDFNARAGVVFILDVPRQEVEDRLKRWQPDGPYWFTDYETFLKVPMGQALIAPIYFRPNGTVEAIKK
jgi:hypothetical protein